MEALRIHVERIVRPVRAGGPRKNKMREELLAHLEQRVREAKDKGMNDDEAYAAAIAQLGDPTALRAELQESVPGYERMLCAKIPFLDAAEWWFDRREGESRTRFALIRTLYTAGFLVPLLLGARLLLTQTNVASILTGGLFGKAPSHASDGFRMFLIASIAIVVTALAYYLADVSGIRRYLSRAVRAGILRRYLSLAVFIDAYVGVFVVASVTLACSLVPPANGVTALEILTVLAKALGPIVLLFHVVGIPFVAWAMTKEHEQYDRWDRLRIEE